MLKAAYKELHKELLVSHRAVIKARWSKNIELSKARLAYEKIQAIRSRLPTTDIEAKLADLEAGRIRYPPIDTSRVRSLVGSGEDIEHLRNVVTYLKNQRIYNELLERYNPGLTMSQEDNVRKTANMVGLKVPDN